MPTFLFLSKPLPHEIGAKSVETNSLDHRKERLVHFKNSFEFQRDLLKTDTSLSVSSSFLVIGALINEIVKNNEFPELVEMAEPLSSTLAEVINYNSTKKELLELLESVISKIDELLHSLSTTEDDPVERNATATLNRVHTDKLSESTSTVVILLGETYNSRRTAFESLISQVNLAMDDLSNAKERNYLCTVLDDLYSFINSLCNEDELAEFQNDFKSILGSISKVELARITLPELLDMLCKLIDNFTAIVEEEKSNEDAQQQKVTDIKNLLLYFSELGTDKRDNWFLKQLGLYHAEEIANMVDYSEYSE